MQVLIKFLRAAMFGLAFIFGLALGAAPSSAADSYPNRQVHWMIGFAPGGPVDIVARIMAQWLSDHFGQQFVVENRAGSGGNIAAAAGINSPPDGYTLLFSGANNAISASLYKKLSFDFIRDTVPVAMFMQVPNMLVVSNAMPVKTVSELIDYCKANPGKISYASSGYGTSVHMSAELFKAMTKCDMVHVPYRGSAVAFPDIISNKVQLIFDNLPTALAQARAGNVRGLGERIDRDTISRIRECFFRAAGEPVDESLDRIHRLRDPERAGVGDAAGGFVRVDAVHFAERFRKIVRAGADAE